MSSKDKNIIRFAVGSVGDIKSNIWRMWVHKNNIYIGAKTSLGVLKVSLHQSETSNIWRIAFVKELKRHDSDSDRVIVRWDRPGEFTSGWTPSIGILIPSIEANRPFKKVLIEDSRIKWVEFPKKGKKILFKVLFSKPGISDEQLKLIMTTEDQLVGRLFKQNGETVWLVAREDDLSSVETEKIVDVMEKTKIHLTPGSSKDSIGDSRALLVVSEDHPTITNQPTILDIPLGKKNIEIPNS